jgi:hypothetical protein
MCQVHVGLGWTALNALQGCVDLEHLAQGIQASHLARIANGIFSQTVQRE